MIARQIPWRLTRRSIPALASSLLIGCIGGILAYLQQPSNVAENLAIASFASAFSAVLATCAWLAWCALSWHLELAQSPTGSYTLRHSGLLFGVAMWSGQSYQFFRQLGDAVGWDANAFRLLFALMLPAPFALWGGLAFRYALDWVFGSRAPRK